MTKLQSIVRSALGATTISPISTARTGAFFSPVTTRAVRARPGLFTPTPPAPVPTQISSSDRSTYINNCLQHGGSVTVKSTNFSGDTQVNCCLGTDCGRAHHYDANGRFLGIT